ncbi:hypothetical protein ACFPVV_01560 [Macrococcoides bohemicum]|nr:hypothetical protein [Macrococcus bohemicus]
MNKLHLLKIALLIVILAEEIKRATRRYFSRKAPGKTELMQGLKINL